MLFDIGCGADNQHETFSCRIPTSICIIYAVCLLFSFCVFHFLVVGSVRQIKLTRVGF